MTVVQYALYVLTNVIYHSCGISNLHNDFRKMILIDNYTVSFIWNFIVLFPYK